jgi:hypothetical protein
LEKGGGKVEGSGLMETEDETNPDLVYIELKINNIDKFLKEIRETFKEMLEEKEKKLKEVV